MLTHSYQIKAVLFDFDGTLTQPGAIDFAFIRETIGCPQDQPILEFIGGIGDSKIKADALETLKEHEHQAAAASMPNSGAEALIAYLKSVNVCVGIISRNGLSSIRRALDNFMQIKASDFQLILSRDDPVDPKPSADGIILAAEKFEVDVKELLVVGDFIFDIEAGKTAGALTAYLTNGRQAAGDMPESDFTVSHLMELKTIIRMGLPLPAGKLPNDLLDRFLKTLKTKDSSVIMRPGVGEDVAAVEIGKAEVLALKSDPITFATDSIGYYAVAVNANDLATSGAVPRWFLTTLLFPCGTTASRILEVMQELEAACRKWRITLCGGHTEVSDAVSRPVVSGMLVGTLKKKDLVDKRNMAPGDLILFTKRVAVEGSAIIAREFGQRLLALGMPEEDIEHCRQFLSLISVIEEANIAARTPGVSAMHDVTEGGLSTALSELSTAGCHRIHVDLETIPYFSQTLDICRLLKIDPLGLIGSGSLLICCQEESGEGLMKSLQAAEIAVACIGRVGERGEGIQAWSAGRPASWPCFKTDEIARLFGKGN